MTMPSRPGLVAATLAAVLSVPGLSQTSMFNLVASGATSSFGSSAGPARDVNGDGFPDIIVGDQEDSTMGAAAGSARVYSGFDGSVLHLFHGPAPGVSLGRVVDGIGDVDLDGHADLVVGASGFVQIRSGASGSIIHNLVDPSSLSFATAVAVVGDVDLDGIDDLALGDPNHSAGRGQITFVSGASGGIIRTILGTTVTSWLGAVHGEGLGSCLDAVGDVNADGIADVVAGAPTYKFCTFGIGGGICYDIGRVYVRDGLTGVALQTWTGTWTASPQTEIGAHVAGVDDVTGDGISEVAFGPDLYGEVWIHSVSTGNRLITYQSLGLGVFIAGDFYGYSVDAAGDVDGDGLGDVIIGAPLCSAPSAICSLGPPGYAQVFAGGTGTLIYTLNGDATNDSFGRVVRGAGDVNGDGFDDLVIGASPYCSVRSGALLSAAAAAQVGTGCWAPAVPVLTATLPVLGLVVTFDVASAPTPSAGLLVASLPVTTPLAVLGGPGMNLPCQIWIDAGLFVSLAVFNPAPSGSWSLTLPLPTVPSQAGLTWALQAAFFPPGGGFGTTNGVHITLGF